MSSYKASQICVSIGTNNFDTALEHAEKFLFTELRLDLCNFSSGEITEFIELSNRVIASHPIETPNRFSSLAFSINAGADIIDIPFAAPVAEIDKLRNEAEKSGCKVLVSFHDLDKTPGKAELLEILSEMETLSPNFLKISCTAKSRQDAADILSLYGAEEMQGKLVAIGMGLHGQITRIANLSLGAPFTFAAPDDTNITAAGQYSAEKMTKILRSL